MKNNKKDYSGLIQNLLYCFPLYGYINKKRVHILVLGYSDLAARFIDFAFEMAQVSGYKLHITVVSDNADAKQQYLGGRPAFCDFFSVDNEVVDDDYGKLSFETIAFGNIDDDISEILLDDEGNKYAYLFIGSDSDSMNAKIAQACVVCRDLLDANFVINCVSEKEHAEDGINYVHRDDSIESHKDYKTLKTMAFNCHLVWNHSKLLDMRKLQRQFLSNYNYVACMSYVISLKYKLASIGIDFLAANAPEEFECLLSSETPSDREILEDMVANEHKRWNVNMICRGFRPAVSMDKYISGEESKANGYHPCLVRSTGIQALNTDKWKNNTCEKWDTASYKELGTLDGLDKVSVLLHREYKKRASKIKRDNIIRQFDVDIIIKLLEGEIKAQNAFNRYYVCLQEISAGNSFKTALYDHYYSALNRELNNLPANKEQIVRKRIEVLAATFYEIIESEKYIDYKQYDVDLIKKIPFILTYKANLHIGVPFDLINIKHSINSAAFRIVETALLINPSRISYICEFERSDLDTLIKMLGYAVKCMDSHHLRSLINICLLTNCPLSEQDAGLIVGISDRITSVECIKGEDEFAEYSKKRHLQIFEINRTRSSSKIEKYEYCCKKNYQYSRNDNTFITTDCNEVKYIPFTPLMRISDIFEFKSAIEDYSFPDMQRDYMFFWGLYKSREHRSELNWKALCEILSKQDEVNRSEIQKIDDKETNIKKVYLIEKVCLDSIKKLCKQAKDVNSSITSSIELYSNSSLNVTINAPEGFHELISKLLRETYKLYDPNSINIRILEGKVYFYYDSLDTGIISPGIIDSVKAKYNVSFSGYKQILNEIQDRGYIRNLSGNETHGFSFSYCTHQVKKIMSQAGRVLELYVYYKLLETGLFDDVANSVEIYWGNDDRKENEIDIIATQGYKVLIVECKAKTLLEQDFYNKLNRLDSDYGLNSVPVMVADTLEIDKHKEENARMMEIGNRVDIHTVYTKDDISDIGNILASIVENHRFS